MSNIINKIKIFIFGCDHVFEELIEERIEIKNNEYDESYTYIRTYVCKKCGAIRIVTSNNILKKNINN